MNMILTRTKDDHLGVWWEPFATSTPLKPKSSAKIVNVTLKELPLHSNSPDFMNKLQKSCRTTKILQKEFAESKQLVSKRTRRKKSSIYFDLTSSSDEESSGGNKKRPIIRLKSGKKIKSILVNKNLSNEKVENLEIINTNKEVNNCRKLENTSVKDCEMNESIHNAENLKFKSIRSHNNNNSSLKLGSDLKDTNLSSDEGSKIFDETRKARSITKDITFHSLNKENTMNNSKSNNSLKQLNKFDNPGKKVLKETFLINPNFTKSLNISVDRASEYNKSCKFQKRKAKDSTSNYVKKTKTKKVTEKLVKHVVDKPVENSESLLHIWEYKNNLSHQLFSDSKGQELINILDLTKEEVDEKVKNMESSLMPKKKKLPYESCNSSHPSINKNLNINKCEQIQSKRKNQNWKKCTTSENPSSELLQKANIKNKIGPKTNCKAKETNNDKVQGFQIQQKSEELNVLSEEVNKENFKNNNNNNNNNRKNLKVQKKFNRKTVNVLQKNKSSKINEFLNQSMGNNKLRYSKVCGMLSSAESNADDNNKISDSDNPLIPKDKKVVNKKKPVFKLLNELSYNESEMGCSVAQGWSINKFKCGVFKLKVKSQMTCKTLHNSSNWGGVLIKGNLKMKIGNRESNLTEGDMVFVPPLTEWQATNTGKCETLFYYWCGRFNV